MTGKAVMLISRDVVQGRAFIQGNSYHTFAERCLALQYSMLPCGSSIHFMTTDLKNTIARVVRVGHNLVLNNYEHLV